MTPLEIHILLHYSHSPRDFREGDFSAPIVGETITRFAKIGLLKRVPAPQVTPSYEIDERGKVFVEALCTLPLPVEVTTWKMP